MLNTQFRPLTISDLPVLERDFPEPAAGSHAKRLKQQTEGTCSYLCAEQNGTIAAIQLIRWRGPQKKQDRALSRLPEVGSLYTLPEFRGQGIGAALVKHSEQLIKSRGYSGVGAIIKDDNTISIHMHLKDGYEKIGEATRTKQDPDKARSYYVKQLG